MSKKICFYCKYYFPPDKKCPRYKESLSSFEKACKSFSVDHLTDVNCQPKKFNIWNLLKHFFKRGGK